MIRWSRSGELVLFSMFMALSGSMCHSPKNMPVVQQSVGASGMPYDLSQPALTISIVSPELQEISGLSPTDQEGVLAAIADEKGEAFLIDGTGSGAIKYRLLFKEKGDFEGIEIVNHTLYAVTSSGKIYEVTDWMHGDKFKVTEYATALEKTNDIEGLCYDKKRNALLVATKEDPEVNVDRTIWAFDLKQKQLSATPVYTIHPDQINALAPWNDQDKKRFFSPSGIAVHPGSNDVYILSSALKRLAVLDYTTGAVKWVERIDKQIIPQPEGISFNAAGDMYISSEGKDGEGWLLNFKQKNK